jgi:ABC-type lipoprotein export system ATPase subunit
MPTLVRIQNLTKTYQRGPEKVEVLHGINLDIQKGDFVALMGPSGSGKTTLLNREHGKTIVMVTHDPKAAEYAKHTLHLDKGTLVESIGAAA